MIENKSKERNNETIFVEICDILKKPDYREEINMNRGN
jgi:hypothetical protein